jgi:hypothetical protein
MNQTSNAADAPAQNATDHTRANEDAPSVSAVMEAEMAAARAAREAAEEDGA